MVLRPRLDPPMRLGLASVRAYFANLLRRAPVGPDGVSRVGSRDIYILPTRTGLLFAAVLLVMLLGSLNYQNNLGLFFTFFLASVALVAMHHTWFDLLGLTLQTRGGPAVFAGETARFEVTLRAEGRRARYDIRVARETQDAPPAFIPAGDQRVVPLALPTRRRGWQPLGVLRVETHYPMQLFRAWSYVETDALNLVYPAPARHAPDPAHDGGERRPWPHRRGGAGSEDYQGSRGYRPGDSPRHIDWKAFARERGLMIKEFGGDQGREVWIDWSRLAVTDPELRLGLLTRQVLDAGEARVRFGLRMPGVLEGLDSGAAHTQRCLTRLALFEHARDTDSAQ